MKTKLLAMVAVGTAALLAGCSDHNAGGSGTDVIYGRVVDSSGNPAMGARVVLDRASGRTALTDGRGEFRFFGAANGKHTVYAYDSFQSAGAALAVDISGGQVTTDGKSPRVSAASTREDHAASASPQPGEFALTSCSGAGGAAQTACAMAATTTSASSISINAITSSNGQGVIDSTGLYGWADDQVDGVAIQIWIPGAFTGTSGTSTYSQNVVNDWNNGQLSAFVGIAPYGQQDCSYYILRTGALTLSVTAGSNGNATFSFGGTAMLFDLLQWDGSVDTSTNANVATASVSGDAWVVDCDGDNGGNNNQTLPTNLGTLQVDQYDMSICDQGSSTGTPEFSLYASDQQDGVTLYLNVPVATLTSGASVALTPTAGNEDMRAHVDVCDQTECDTFHFTSGTATVSGTVDHGQQITFTLSNASFVDDGGAPFTLGTAMIAGQID